MLPVIADPATWRQKITSSRAAPLRFPSDSEEQQEARVDAFSPVLVYIRSQCHKPETAVIAHLRDAS